MIGVFDSGEGGRLTVEIIREHLPEADIAFIADSKNAPYGTKSRTEIISYSKENIRRLCEVGAKKILIACCTASTVYPSLSTYERSIAIPIIEPTAIAAIAETKTYKIGVIATQATVRAAAFSKCIRTHSPKAKVTEIATQELVSLIEGGARDENISRGDLSKIKSILGCVKDGDFDTLILGCTHFPRLIKTISDITEKRIVSSAHMGALEIIKYSEEKEKGITLYL